MKKIFIENDPELNSPVYIKGEDYFHLARVLRIKKKDNFLIGGKSGEEFVGEVDSIDGMRIGIIIKEKINRPIKKMPELILFFCLLKGDKNELIIQKCSEIGINKFIPVITKNTIVKMKETGRKHERLRKIARETSMQACLLKIPQIYDFTDFNDINKIKIKGIKLFGDLNEENEKLPHTMPSDEPCDSVALFIGPEGDLTDNEKILLRQWGWSGIKLSQNILRGETACIYISSIIYYYFWSKE